MTESDSVPTPTLAAPRFTPAREPAIRVVENALVVPVQTGAGNGPVQRCGVFTADGELVPEAITWRGEAPLSQPPPLPEPAAFRDLAGDHMFAGILFGHFGHFIVESTTRLWAWAELQGRVRSLLFMPKVQRNTVHVLNVQTPFLRLLGIDCALENLEGPVRVERLHVPDMGFGLNHMIEGTEAYRNFMRGPFATMPEVAGAERLYVSRSRLPPERGGVLSEERIEGWLEAEGYEIFHPQFHSFAEQVDRYRAARFIISPDGSPIHLMALACRPGTRIAIVPRRPDGVAAMLARQLQAFAGIEAEILDPPHRNWIPVKDSRPSRSSFGEIDLEALGRTLTASGYVAGGAGWTNPDEAERAASLAAIETRQKTAFKPFEGRPRQG